MDFQATIVEKVKAGDSAAFEYLVRKYQRPLFQMVVNLLGRSHRVEDLVQEILLTAYRHIGTYQPERARFSTWLFRIARNACFNELKKKKEMGLEHLPEPAGHDDPDKTLVMKEIFQKLDQALETMPFAYRVVFVLIELQGLSHEQVAVIEGTRIGTVKSRLSRCKQKLRRVLEGQ
jgi:RNA polymerase sigma-70 factor (ECF subfamily)